MAGITQVEDAWDDLVEMLGDDVAALIRPVTYMNSSAAIKGFTGRHGGTICTSSNAKTALQWAFDETGGVEAGGKALFLPDQHLGRNTAVRDLGLSLADCVVWDPHRPHGGLTPHELRAARMILWRGALLGPRPVCGRGGRAGATRDPRRQGHRAPRMPLRGMRAGR